MTRRLLLVSYAFPPFNSVGAVRVGKIAKYLTESGWDIRVLSAEDQPFGRTLPLGIDASRVTYTPSIKVKWVRRLAASGGQPYEERGADGSPNALRLFLKTLYTNLFYLPDSSIGWWPFAVGAGRRLTEDWKPDVIYASGPPFTSLMVAQRLAKSLGVPWVAELRDLWTGSPYYPWVRPRRWIDRLLERHTLSSASGFVGATAAIASELAAVYRKPAMKILSGFEPLDSSPGSVATATDQDDRRLRIVYTGSIYRDKRDPTMLFEAMRELPSDRIRVDFYGRHLESLRPVIQAHRLEHCVTLHGMVPFPDAVAKQAQADLLLLLLWLDPGDDGSIPAKVYEYLSAGRAILGIGLESSEASRLIAATGAGRVFGDKGSLVAALRDWLTQKAAAGAVPPVDSRRVDELTSRAQMQKLSGFLSGIAP